MEEEDDPGALTEAISVLRSAAGAFPTGSPGNRVGLSNPGYALWLRYERAGDDADLDAAISTILRYGRDGPYASKA